MRLIERIRAEFRTRGTVGFLGFVRTRLWQDRQDVLFEMSLPRKCDLSPVARLPGVVVIDRENVGSRKTAAVEREVLTDSNHAYRAALSGGDILFAAVDRDGCVSTYGFVLFESFYKRILGESSEVPMIGNCFTLPARRGRGLYAALLVSICEHLAVAGHKRAIISCSPDNSASMRGIQKAGFSRMKTLRSVVLFSRWIVFQTCVADVPQGEAKGDRS